MGRAKGEGRVREGEMGEEREGRDFPFWTVLIARRAIKNSARAKKDLAGKKGTLAGLETPPRKRGLLTRGREKKKSRKNGPQGPFLGFIFFPLK